MCNLIPNFYKHTHKMNTINANNEITIVTNNKPRDLFYWSELEVAECVKLRKEFDYCSDLDFDCMMFFRYRNNIYSLGEFLRTEGELLEKGWQGLLSDSFFSGVVVKIVEDCERVVVGLVYA